MEEVEIFSQFIRSYEEEDSIFLRLTTDMDISVSKIKPISLTMNEKMGRGTPSIVFDFIDGGGDLSNHNIPHSGALFFLDIGRGIVDTTRFTMRVSKLLSLTSTNGSEQLTYRMFFVHAGWDKFIGKTMCRGWGEKNPSDVITEIAMECGWGEVDTFDCDEEFNIIQPNCTNVDFMKWLANKSTMETGMPRYSGTLENKFIYKSIQRIITENTAPAAAGALPVIRMEGQMSTSEATTEATENSGIPKYFTTYKIHEKQVEKRLAGAGGFKSYTYDSHKDEFKIDSWTIADVDSPQLSDWVSSPDSFEKSEKPIFCGRGEDNRKEAIRTISNTIDDAIELDITTAGSTDIKVGIMIEVLIPVPPTSDVGDIYNIMYSGFWIVSEVSHWVKFEDSSMTTHTKLIRSGHDSKQLSGFERTAGGKFIGG